MNPLRDHYGLTDAQITRMAEIDLQYLPDAQHRGRDVWLQRQQEHIALAIRAGTPEPPATATTRDPLLVLTAIEPTRQRELIEKTQPMATSVELTPPHEDSRMCQREPVQYPVERRPPRDWFSPIAAPLVPILFWTAILGSIAIIAYGSHNLGARVPVAVPMPEHSTYEHDQRQRPES